MGEHNKNYISKYKNKILKPGTILTWELAGHYPHKIILIVLGYKLSFFIKGKEILWLWNMKGYELHYEINFFTSFKTQRNIKNFKIIE